MKIVHIITRLIKGGAEDNTLMTCLHQARSGHEVTLIFGPDNLTLGSYASYEKEVCFCPVSFLRHPINPKNDLRGLFEVIAVLKKIKPDVVHTHTSKAGILGRLAAKCAGVPYIVHGVHILPFSNAGFVAKIVYLAVEHATVFFTDLFVHVSQGTRQAYRRAKIGQNIRHDVVYSGMDVNKFITAQEPENWRELLRVPSESPKPKVMLMLAVMEPRKQHLEFLDGFAKATKPGDPIRLVFAGEGSNKEKVNKKIAALGLNDRVIDLGYSPSPEKLIALADVGVLASVREGLPRVVVQYLAGKRPAVVSNIDGIEEIVKDGVNGIVVRSIEAEDVAVAAVDLLNNPTLFKRLKEGAANTDVSPWSFESMFAGLDRCYKCLRK